MRSAPKTTQDKRNQQIARMYLGKFSLTEIGKKFDISPQRVWDIAKRELGKIKTGVCPTCGHKIP
jgi:DNA-directed RNA polymerase specialized sigma subunit